MTDDNTHKTAFYALLAKHNCKPSTGGETWAQEHWFDLESVMNRISSLQSELKYKIGKDKAVICSVLEACLTAAIDDRHKRYEEDKAVIDSLQNLVKILQSQLNEERNENHILRNALRDEYCKNQMNSDSLKETEQTDTLDTKQIYPHKELETVKNCGEYCCPHLRPLIKTEFNYIGDDDYDPHITSKETPFTATELVRLKKEYSRLPHEMETEYVFRVSLTGGDQIKLTEQEASGSWGHGVFLTTGDKRNAWSITQRAAFWAGGINALERGDPVAIPSTSDNILESVQKAARLQMIHERKLIPGYDSPMQLPVKPEIMTPLIRGLPEFLKPTAIALQKTITALSPVERLERFLGNPSERNPSNDQNSSPNSTSSHATTAQTNPATNDRKVWVWSEIAVELINYCRQYGPVSTSQDTSQKIKGIRNVKTAKNENSDKGKNISTRQHGWLLGIKRGVPKDVMDGLPLDKLQKIISNWHFKKPSLPALAIGKKTQPNTHSSSDDLGSEPRNNQTIQSTAPPATQQANNKSHQTPPTQDLIDFSSEPKKVFH
ncbi:uncharacterized protein LOC134565238 [Prinia subflava]|uniref:uncharacterized protein LOC134565238 n=1 Tax=Prinia subflava TaxID=208062 RepID=UPI002FE22EB3